MPVGRPFMEHRVVVAVTLAAIVAASLTASLRADAQGAPAAPAAWKRAGTVDAGFVSSTGNTDVTTISFGDKFSASRGPWTLSQALAYVYGKTKGVESANQLRIGSRAEYAFNGRVGAFAAATYERNAFAGFNRRTDELLGIQWRPLSTGPDTLTLDGGGVLTQQVNTDGTSESSPAARVAAAYRHTFKANTYIGQNAEWMPNLEESGAYRLNSETVLVAPISARVNLKVAYLVQYNSRPPAKFGTTDRVFTSGIQLSF